METQQLSNQENRIIEHRNELADYLDQKLVFKGKCASFKYIPKSMNYMITLTDLKASSSQIFHLKLDYHVNIFAKPRDIVDIGLNYTIEFEATVIAYYTWKKVEGINIKVKNYGLKLVEIIDFEKGENKNGNN